jgi:predicted Zn-dependent protease
VPVTIKVLDAEEVNAMALPGGFFFVNSGLVLKAENEAELAGVMAHEIAHIAARHGTRQATRGQLVNLASIPLIFMGGWTGYGIRQAASILIPVTFLKFSRGFEQEADLLGLQYMYKAGYDPTSFVDFFEKIQSMEKRRPGTMSKVFSSHPMTDDRIKNSQENIEEYLKARPEYVVTTSEFNDVKARLSALQNRRKVDEPEDNRPRLKKAPGGNTTPIEGDKTDDKSGNKSGGDDEDDRPVLKRRN